MAGGGPRQLLSASPAAGTPASPGPGPGLPWCWSGAPGGSRPPEAVPWAATRENRSPKAGVGVLARTPFRGPLAALPTGPLGSRGPPRLHFL